MGFEAAETTHKINDAFGPGTANEHPMQCGSGSFAKEMRVLKVRSTVASHLRGSSKLILLQLHKKRQRTQHPPFYCHSAFEANWKGEKAR